MRVEELHRKVLHTLNALHARGQPARRLQTYATDILKKRELPTLCLRQCANVAEAPAARLRDLVRQDDGLGDLFYRLAAVHRELLDASKGGCFRQSL